MYVHVGKFTKGPQTNIPEQHLRRQVSAIPRAERSRSETRHVRRVAQTCPLPAKAQKTTPIVLRSKTLINQVWERNHLFRRSPGKPHMSRIASANRAQTKMRTSITDRQADLTDLHTVIAPSPTLETPNNHSDSHFTAPAHTKQNYFTASLPADISSDHRVVQMPLHQAYTPVSPSPVCILRLR